MLSVGSEGRITDAVRHQIFNEQVLRLIREQLVSMNGMADHIEHTVMQGGPISLAIRSGSRPSREVFQGIDRLADLNIEGELDNVDSDSDMYESDIGEE